MTRETHEQHINDLRGRSRCWRPPRFASSRTGGFTGARIRQLTALSLAIGLLVGVTDSGAFAGVTGFGSKATVKSRQAERRLAERRLAERRLAARLALGRAGLGTLSEPQFRTATALLDRANHHHSPPPTSTTLAPPTTTTTDPAPTYPYGIPDANEPSGMAPPTTDALPGYSQSYVNDFTGSSLPDGWDVFTGNPGGDPGAQWAASHVTVGSGLLSLNTWKDPAYGDEWVAGGLCQCGLTETYGAYFVRSRVTGSGPTQVQLLWPTQGWPPEIDFNETDGSVGATTATVHWGTANHQEQHRVTVDMTQWHTWGVIWSPTSIIYTLDGQAWASVQNAAEIPDQPMTLDLTQQTWCTSFWACPTAPQSVQVDWVAEYQP